MTEPDPAGSPSPPLPGPDAGAELAALVASCTLPTLEREAMALAAKGLLRQLRAGTKSGETLAELERLFARLREAQPGRRGRRSKDKGPPLSAELDPAKVERLAVRLRPGRSPRRAAMLAGLASDPQLPALLDAAQASEWAGARAGSRQYAAEVISEARLLGLLRLREEMHAAPIGVVSQILSALEKTAEAIGEERPRTQLVYVRQFVASTEEEAPGVEVTADIAPAAGA